jgi:serine protease
VLDRFSVSLIDSTVSLSKSRSFNITRKQCIMHLRQSTLSAAVATGLSFALVAASASAGELRTAAKPVEGRYIVVLKPQIAKLSAETKSRALRVPEIARQMSTQHRVQMIRSYEHALRGFVVKADDAALAKLIADPRVQYVEEDGIVSLSATQTGATWGLDRIDQRALPLNTTYTYTPTGAGVRAYVVDSGLLATHSDFTGRVGAGFTAINDGRGTGDCNGHGTHVAGTLGGTTWGVAKGVTIHPVRVFGCGRNTTWSEVIAGVDWIRANHIKPAVANLSLGDPANTSADAAVNNLINAGVTVVVAAGNNAADACNYSPARVPGAITVGAIDSNDARSASSNFGSCVDIFAPGGAVRSAWWTSATAANTLGGTSMAAPHVAGAAALFMSGSPTATPAQVATALINRASINRVILPGTASPNRLLSTLTTTDTGPGTGTAPTITGLVCPDPATSGGNNYFCRVTFSSATSAVVVWPDGNGGSTYSALCNTGQQISVKVTVANIFGSATRTSATFTCPSGPIP